MRDDIFKDPNYMRWRAHCIQRAVEECMPIIHRHGLTDNAVKAIRREYLDMFPDPKGKWAIVVTHQELIEDVIPKNAIIDRVQSLVVGKAVNYHY